MDACASGDKFDCFDSESSTVDSILLPISLESSDNSSNASPFASREIFQFENLPNLETRRRRGGMTQRDRIAWAAARGRSKQEPTCFNQFEQI